MQVEAGDLEFEALPVKADDYELTLFKIKSDKKRLERESLPDLGPVLFIHGLGDDAQTWLQRADTAEDALPAQLYEQGHDVYFANLRGTQYSRFNKKLDADSPRTAAKYWDFDASTLAEVDLPAIINTVLKETESCKKLTLVGHSQGSQVIVNHLAKKEDAEQYIAQVAHIAPCIVASPFPEIDEETFNKLHAAIVTLDIQSLYGPTWEEQEQQLCAFDEDVCDLFEFKEVYDPKTRQGEQEIGVKYLLHLIQQQQVEEFQEYAPFYWLGYGLETLPKDIPVENIKVPMNYLFA